MRKNLPTPTIAALAIFAGLIFTSTINGAETLEKAFAFGADSWTRAVPNSPGDNYIKVNQNGFEF